MALEQKYKIPYFDICTGKWSTIKEFAVNESIEFKCDSSFKYGCQYQIQPIFSPIKFKIVGAKCNASISYSIPYTENEEAYLSEAMSDVNGVVTESFLELNMDNFQNISKNINPSAKTGISPIVTQNASFKQEKIECDLNFDSLPIFISIRSDIFYKIVRIKSISA